VPESMTVRHEDKNRFAVAVRGHELVVDQPGRDGGGDAGPTPTELFVAGLASCVAFYAGRFLARHDVSPGGLAVTCDWEMAVDRPARVASIRVRIDLPDGFPPELRDRLVAVATHCTVHNSLERAPQVDIVTTETALA
jgi:putative redox protein